MALKIMDESGKIPKNEYATEALEYAIKMGAIISCNSYGIECFKYNVKPDGHLCDKYFDDFSNFSDFNDWVTLMTSIHKIFEVP